MAVCLDHCRVSEWWGNLQSHSSPCVLSLCCKNKACSLHWATCQNSAAFSSPHCNVWQPITYYTRNDLLLTLHWFCTANTPDTEIQAGAQRLHVSRPSKMAASHTVRQNIPLSKAIDRTNIMESPPPRPTAPPPPAFRASLSLSLLSMSKHTLLTWRLPDPLLTPAVTSAFQRLQQPGREAAHIHTYPHTHWTHRCSNMCAQVLKHSDRLQMGRLMTRRANSSCG